jgi:L-lactate dehydrogenase
MGSTWKSRKVVIVGAGSVGSTFAYALAQSRLADEIRLLDANRNLAEGQVLDLAHGLPYYPPIRITSGSKNDYADASVIVVTAGAKQNPGETRLDLLQKNASMMESIMDEIHSENSQAVLVVATNPVDIITHVALKHSGWQKNRVIGSGTVLDSARFRYLISQHFQLDVGNVHAYILGEHGDSELPAWSMTNVAGIPIDEYARKYGSSDWTTERERIAREVKDSAYHIINYKGATYYAIGMALVRIVGAILQDQSSVLTVSAFLDGEYGLHDVCMGVPCVLGQGGVLKIVEAPLDTEERKALEISAATLKDALKNLHEQR